MELHFPKRLSLKYAGAMAGWLHSVEKFGLGCQQPEKQKNRIHLPRN